MKFLPLRRESQIAIVSVVACSYMTIGAGIGVIPAVMIFSGAWLLGVGFESARLAQRERVSVTLLANLVRESDSGDGLPNNEVTRRAVGAARDFLNCDEKNDPRQRQLHKVKRTHNPAR